jgi:glycosyltransferase involved in cell wall biosynthesis
VPICSSRIRSIDLESASDALSRREETRREFGIGEQETVAAIFGRLEPWKGQHVFLRAAAQAAAHAPGSRFLVVGGALFGLHPGYSESLRQLATQLGMNGKIQFLGHRQDVFRLMAATDIVVHASTEPEPWGLVVAEAMATGRAVIAAAAGGPQEMIRDGVNGILSPPANERALAAALVALLNDPEQRERLGRMARQFVEENLELRACTNRFLEKIENLRDQWTA